MSNQMDGIFTIDEFDANLKAGKGTVYQLATSGKLSASKLAGTWCFRCGNLEEWIASRIGNAMEDEDGEAK